MKQFFGKYRGKVEGNSDSMQLGRIQVSVPAVYGDGRSSWAMPCVPYAGSSVGFFLIPPQGAHVWVEFEGGDPDYPIWSGCYWASGELPSQATSADVKVIKTGGVTMTLNESSSGGGLTIEVGSPIVSGSTLRMVLNSGGIEISNGSNKIKLTTASVSINDSAFEVI